MGSDATRPRIHFTAQAGWINDPLGLTYRDGTYHLFFQFVPGQTEWGPHQRWGHATSSDALHWTEGPVALEPGDGDDGVWSGSIVQPDGAPAALFYTTVGLADVQIGRARIARADDGSWATWTKGPVVAALPDDVEAIAYRDPYVFHDGEHWRMLMGAGLADGTATALLHTSDDLVTWSYDGPLASRAGDQTDPLWTGTVWECPQLFPMGERWVLTVSVWEPGVPHYEAYAVGAYADGRFTAETWGRLSYGPSYYAASAFADADGTRGLIYWLRGVDDTHGRWASAHSVPHVLHLDGERLAARPHPSVAAQRRPATVVDGAHVPSSATVDATCDVEWQAHDGAELSVSGLDGAPVLRLVMGADGLRLEAGDHSWTMPAQEGTLRVLLDGPVLEVFGPLGTLAAPVPAGGPRVVLSASSSIARAHDLA